MYSIKSLFAFIAYLIASLALLWGITLTAAGPRVTKLEAATTGSLIFGLSSTLLVTSWKLVRLARKEIDVYPPHVWRISDYVLCAETFLSGLYLLASLCTFL